MSSTVTLQIAGGVRVVVPDSLHLITPYVLLEQGDWFEDEIKFLRCLLQTGQRVIDIGANHGVYSLSMAQTVGPTGRVWAFEPASTTARLLAESIAVNGFAQVQLEKSALSDRCGTATLFLDTNSELNAIVSEPAPGSASETVPLLTLDECMQRQDWRDIDFLKIDAEGEEGRILAGGARFFAGLSPLVQYEVKAGRELHLGLVQQFAALGYASYRLVPGLDLLVPFDPAAVPDGYLLNLFCCKADRAAGLAAQGFLFDPRLPSEPGGSHPTPADARHMAAEPRYHWRHTPGRLGYGRQLMPHWPAGDSDPQLTEALALHALAHDIGQPISLRFLALEASLDRFSACLERQPQQLHRASVARVAAELGARAVAVAALQQLFTAMQQTQPLDARQPFLAPSSRFDAMAPGEAVGNWLLAAATEELERLGSYSSFYTGESAHPRLELIHAIGLGSDEMRRRLHLVRKRFNLAVPAA